MEITDDMMREVFDRLRETEAQTREQNVKIAALTDSNKEYVGIVSKFIERGEKRETLFFRIIVVLVGAVIALALGPKVAKELLADKMTGGVAIYQPAIPLHDERHTFLPPSSPV